MMNASLVVILAIAMAPPPPSSSPSPPSSPSAPSAPPALKGAAADAVPTSWPPPSEIGRVIDIDLPSLDGARITNKDIAGQPTVLFFAATWCAGSKKLAPEIEKLVALRAGRGVRVVLVNVGEAAAVIAKTWREKQGLKLPIALDVDGAFAKTLAPPPSIIEKMNPADAMTAQTLVLDKDRRLHHWVFTGPTDPYPLIGVAKALDELAPPRQ